MKYESMLVPPKSHVCLNIFTHPVPSKAVLRNPHILPVNAGDALWGILKVVAGSQSLSLGKALSAASG